MVTVVYSSLSSPPAGTFGRPALTVLNELKALDIAFDLPNDRRFPIFISALGEIIWSATIWVHSAGIKSASGSKKTIQTYTEHMVCWLRFLERHPSNISESTIDSLEGRIEDATEETLLALRNGMRDGISERTGKPLETSTINDRTSAIERFYIWADKKGFFSSRLRYSPSQYYSGYLENQANESYRLKLNQDEQIPQLVPTSTFHRILSLATKSERLAYRWMLCTGARRSETCAFNIGDVPDVSDADPSITPIFDIRIRRKGGKYAPLKVPFHLIEELNWYIALERLPELKRRKISDREIDAQPVFVNSQGNRFSGDHFGARFRAYARQCNIDCTPHDLRHTYATCALKMLDDMARKGRQINPLKILQILLGHSQISSVEIYLKALDINSAEVVKVLDYLYGSTLKNVDLAAGVSDD
ncbi:site-specific integrase [Herbaspirillum lusitanum]|uniref:tyrosine-type recombinase/integrase n=1 Tax=Herbaspirillum lusitanum TaxID=213312 RepID=UPI00223818A7|nr:site-specific integrase [Herbaspirillum lusitanum]MCW5297341.1 site-specific integrase [Herbaspirillum lusitanum]